jgi:hypothetical protein
MCLPLGIYDYLVKIRIYHMTAQLLQVIEELEEVFLDQLVNQPMQERVIELALCWRGDPAV